MNASCYVLLRYSGFSISSIHDVAAFTSASEGGLTSSMILVSALAHRNHS